MQPIKTPPRTIMEVYQMLPEGTLAELIQGSIFMSPAPTTDHQRVIRDLAFSISAHVKQENLGEILFSPCDVYLDHHANAVQPDIIFVAKERASIIAKDAIQGIPDMVIEILSLGNSSHDLVLKKQLYERFGVKEYWVVNPESKETIGFYLKNSTYNESGRFTGKIVSIVLQQEFHF